LPEAENSMKQPLSRDHRKTLETAVAQARATAEAGAKKALKALAVAAKDAPTHSTEAQKKLRVRLRAHGRALGDPLRADDTQAIDHLVTEIAYEHWHRMRFARFLAESDLLMHPDGYPVARKTPKASAHRRAAHGKSPATTPGACCPTSPDLPMHDCITALFS
jgi:hypothetical protein